MNYVDKYLKYKDKCTMLEQLIQNGGLIKNNPQDNLYLLFITSPLMEKVNNSNINSYTDLHIDNKRKRISDDIRDLSLPKRSKNVPKNMMIIY